MKTIKVKVTMNSTLVYTASSPFKCLNDSDMIFDYTLMDSIESIPKAATTEDIRAYKPADFGWIGNVNGTDKAFVTYVYGYTANGKLHNQIEKPLILVEGIDFFSKINDLGFDAEFGKCGSNGLSDFLAGKQWDWEKGKWDESWEAIKGAPKLIEMLRKEGYDIIYLDFFDGAQDMNTNAMLLVELINKINNGLGHSTTTNNVTSVYPLTQDIAVLGASMGGQVAKYALSFMEHNNMKHCCRLYVSFDSPHSGANIPISMQLMLQYFSGPFRQIKKSFDKIAYNETPKQLLNNYYSTFGNVQHDSRTAWLDKVNEVGNFPDYTRNIAIACGDINGGLLPFQAGDLMVRFGLNSGVFNRKGLRWLQTPYADMFAQCGTTGKKDASKTDVILMCNRVGEDYREIRAPFGCKPWDNCAGGKRYDFRDNFNVDAGWTSMALQDAYCFVPTISSLDINTSDVNFNVLQNWNVRDKPSSISHFEAYFGPVDENQDHVMMDIDNGTWLRDELLKNEYDLPYILEAVSGGWNGVYNFANLANRTIKTIRIRNGGTVQINNSNDATNRHQGTAISSLTLKNHAQGGIFNVSTKQCGAVVTLS
ncbi:MAG: hypothetical protein HYZ42_14615 [Bacteroidetes bacterium]|nr:hypothetical protein [Bacteroidota bacterium]